MNCKTIFTLSKSYLTFWTASNRNPGNIIKYMKLQNWQSFEPD